jgi:XTP/dITP diphosphohydrolase
MEILLASNNKHKVEEFRRIFSDHILLTPEETGIDFHVYEDGATYLENALKKASVLYKQTGRIILADDSGLSVEYLEGAPGIHSARFGSGFGANLKDGEKNTLLLEKMGGVNDRKAFFVCCLILYVNEYRFFICQETLEGLIAEKPAGLNGFGYDPVFYVPEKSCTVAELSKEEKDIISHRGKAARHVLSILKGIKAFAL